MPSKRLILSAITVIVASLFFITPVLACNYPGPNGSSITVFTHTSDGTPLPDTQLTLSIYNGSHKISTESGSTGGNGKFTFPNDGSGRTGLSYKVDATYYGDTVTVECDEPAHSASFGPFSLSVNENKNVDISIPGVTVEHGGDASATPKPSTNPAPTVKPITPKGNHSSYPPMADGDVAGSVAGVVLDVNSGEPVCGAYVVIGKADGGMSAECYDSGMTEYSCQYTDNNGFFQFTGVNSTTDAAYKLFVSNGCGDVAYSDPFKVGSGESVQINMKLGKSEDAPTTSPTPTVTIEPSVTPVPDNATVTPVPSTEAPDIHTDVVMTQGSPNIIDQIGSFIGSLISGIVPK